VSSRQNSLDKLILLILSATLTFHVGINYLSGKRTLSSSYKMRVFLSSKRGKRRITEIKRIAMSTKQIKQKIRMIITVTSIR